MGPEMWSDQQSIEILATTEVVYALVSDLTRTGEHSPECHKVDWLARETEPAPGGRFIGHNRAGPFSWTRQGRVLTAEPGTEFSFMIEWRDHDSTLWTYRLTPTTKGTLVTESYELKWSPWWMRVVDTVTFRKAQLSRNIAKTLTRLKHIIESGVPA